MALLTFPWPQLLDSNGNTYPGAKLYFYETGTSTPASTYTDAALTTAHTNPVVADAQGVFAPIYLADTAYKVVLKTSADAVLYSADPVTRYLKPGEIDDFSVTAASIAALKAIDSPSNGDGVQVPVNVDGGLFVFDSSLTGAADNIETYKADDATTGSWKRVRAGGVPYSPALGGSQIEIVAGTIKQNTTTRTQWDYISDASHAPLGVSGSYATATGSVIQIDYGKTYSRVISFVCGPDETLANAYGLSIGASVGLSNAQIKASISQTLAAQIYYDGADWQTVYGTGQGGSADYNVNITSMSYASGSLTINHDRMNGADISILAHSRDGAVTPYVPFIRSQTSTQVVVGFLDVVGGALVTGGTPTTSCSLLITKRFGEGILLDGTAGSDTYQLDGGNLWFYGIFEV